METATQPTKLTITFPLYGQIDLVERAFTALANQTCQHFKIICIDDQSPHNFEALAQKFKDQLDITIEYNQTNLGAMRNIWKSIQIDVPTPYIMSHHADDFLKADYIEKALQILEQNPEISFVVTGPKWVPKEIAYTYALLGQVPWEKFSAAKFAYNILQFAPYIFGSVIYRRSHLVPDWKLETMDTYADRYFLGEILRTHNTYGAYIHGDGIFERDHAQDITDTRSPKLKEEHAITLLSFYKQLLLAEYPKPHVETIITNALLYYYGNFASRSGLASFYKKQKPANLLQIGKIRSLGLYSILVLPFSPGTKRRILQIIKKISRTFRII